ncbi:MAG: glycosyltransferase [Pseudomonadota bacterium]
MPDPLRVSLLTAKMSPAAGGLSVSVPGLAHGLDVFEDVEMYVLGTQDPMDPAAANKWGPRVHAFRSSAPSALQRAPAMALALERLAPDVVDVQGLWSWSSKVSLQHWRRHRKPYVVTPRGMLDPWARRNSAWKKKLFAAVVETEHLRNAFCIRATAEMEAQHFRNIGLYAPIAIVPNAISISELAPRRKSHRRQALFLSRIHPKKGVDVLLHAWAKLEDRNPDWDLVIAGIDENGHESALKVLARRLKLQRVDFVGPKHGSEKEALYRNSDLFVLPTHAENFGLVIAEALAQELPVITTTNAPWSGLRDMGCGWWIPPGNTKLAEAMEEAMRQPNHKLRAMGTRGRAWIQESFDPRQVAAKMREVYLWTASRAARPEYVYS